MENIETDNMPTFLEELKMFLEKLNEAFPGVKDTGKRHNVTLDANGHLEVVVWAFNSANKLGAYYANLESEDDLFQSMDDIIDDLRKYIEQNAQ